MIKIGIVPCQNGLGHISRSIDLSNELTKKYHIFLISNVRKNKKFKIKKNVKQIHFFFEIDLKKKKHMTNFGIKN